ncbi:MAG: 23S rRNA (adenine(2503)-C(2))-methyltransferase RlmN [Gemmatimonadota bacterium]|nr:23S rRNA (adenine(2503)-C(2))-methyltransferase RlmN [Gemmatimonadota bacterium]
MRLFNQTPSEAETTLGGWLRARGEPSFRTSQILQRIWQQPVGEWAGISNIPKILAHDLDEWDPIPRLEILRQERSRDKTVKILWGLPDGLAVESVWIPEGARRTVCISSQAGCAYGCVFCATGKMGFQRHLEPWEIVGQVREFMLREEFGKPTNVVFMGMGEPLHNWDAVDTALTILNDPNGVAVGARHITVSTVGIVPRLADLAKRPEQFRLAISLHAATSEKRAVLMPVEKKYPLAQLIESLKAFERRITFEYVLIRGKNDDTEDAKALADLAKPLGAHVNLLPLHPGGSSDLAPATEASTQRFLAVLQKRHVQATVRRSRGLDINAACGQLTTEAAKDTASLPNTIVTSKKS